MRRTQLKGRKQAKIVTSRLRISNKPQECKTYKVKTVFIKSVAGVRVQGGSPVLKDKEVSDFGVDEKTLWLQ